MTSHGAEKPFPIKSTWLLVLGATLVVACVGPGDNRRAPTEISSPQAPPPGGSVPDERYVLSGVLTLRTTTGSIPLANAGVAGFMIRTDGRGYGLAPVSTDADGQYQFPDVPNGVVVLRGDRPGFYQPCAAIATVSGANSVKDFEIVDSAAMRPETTADSPRLSGVVYRKADAGKQAVAGAVIEFEYSPVVAATTITDAQGRYSFCHLPTGRGGLDMWLNGIYLGGAVLYTFGDDVMDFDF